MTRTGDQGLGSEEASGSAAGSHGFIKTSNRYAELEAARQAEEIADKAERELVERSMDQWDPGRRNELIATRKQQWLSDKRKLE
eukprot:2811468-Heterocapsa_arctica.AAC.1